MAFYGNRIISFLPPPCCAAGRGGRGNGNSRIKRDLDGIGGGGCNGGHSSTPPLLLPFAPPPPKSFCVQEWISRDGGWREEEKEKELVTVMGGGVGGRWWNLVVFAQIMRFSFFFTFSCLNVAFLHFCAKMSYVYIDWGNSPRPQNVLSPSLLLRN